MKPTDKKSAEYDSLIFDMDGTLWDAADSYAEIWNITNRQLNIDRPDVTRGQLLSLMGKTIDIIYDEVMGNYACNKDEYLKLLDYNESTMMPKLGGKLYPGVKEGLELLSSRYPLYMASNCGADGLVNMLEFTRLSHLFKGTITHGETGLGKGDNISLLIKNHSLSKPLYIGDTQSDADASHQAGIDMCHARWGFGNVKHSELAFDSFAQMVEHLMK